MLPNDISAFCIGKIFNNQHLLDNKFPRLALKIGILNKSIPTRCHKLFINLVYSRAQVTQHAQCDIITCNKFFEFISHMLELQKIITVYIQYKRRKAKRLEQVASQRTENALTPPGVVTLLISGNIALVVFLL